MRILCIADEFAWPPTNGYRIRLGTVLGALAKLGEVDYLAVLNDDRVADPAAVPSGMAPARAETVRVRAVTRGPRALARLVVRRLPRRVAWQDWAAARRRLEEWREHPYDLVWCAHADTYAQVSDLLDHPLVVDLDNLEDRSVRRRRRIRPGRESLDARSRLRRAGARVFDARDEARWARLQRQILRDAQVAVVCSEVDRRRLHTPRAAVVPNGYEPPAAPPPAVAHDVPVVTMVGLFVYEPNLDAARLLAREVLPRVRERVPGVELHLVGRHDGALAEVARLPGVVVTGEVDDVGTELARTDVVAVPVRFGSGTRVKILEAFAYGLPVVATTVGAEGLDVHDGEHLLVADDANAIAAACADLLTDPGLARRVGDAGRVRWAERYRAVHVEEAVAAVVRGVAGGVAGRVAKGTGG